MTSNEVIIEHVNYMEKITKEKNFYNPTDLIELRNNLIEFYASFFTNNDHTEALKSLEKARLKVSSDDETTNSFFVGMFLSLALCVGILLLTPGDMEYSYNSEWVCSIFPVFRYSLMINLSVFGAAFCVRLFKKYKINYLLFFGVSSRDALSYEALKKLGISFLYTWVLFLFLQVFTFKYSLMPTNSSIFALAFFLLQVILLILPFDILNRQCRYEFLYTLYKIITAPYSKVRFRDSFLADILCSAVKPLQDVLFCISYFTTNAWQVNEHPTSIWLSPLSILMAILPFYWRLMQCIRNYNDSNSIWPHLVNAGKYLSSIAVGILNIIKLITGYPLIRMYVSAYIITTLYSYIWDITIDWSLLRIKSRYLFLRNRLKFAPKYYYFAMVSNLVLRFSWTLTLFVDSSFNGSVFGVNVVVLVISLCEVLRRIQWSVYRLENESYCNAENNYKEFVEIPYLLSYSSDL